MDDSGRLQLRTMSIVKAIPSSALVLRAEVHLTLRKHRATLYCVETFPWGRAAPLLGKRI